MTVATLLPIFAGYRYTHTNEALLQQAIWQILTENRIEFLQEYHITQFDRPDFFVSGIAIELKVNGTTSEVTRQLDRYAAHESVTEIILITTRSKHRKCAGHLRGKKVTVLWIGGNAL